MYYKYNNPEDYKKWYEQFEKHEAATAKKNFHCPITEKIFKYQRANGRMHASWHRADGKVVIG